VVDRIHTAAVVDGVGAAVARARARGRVREGTPAVRARRSLVPGGCSTCAPTCCARPSSTRGRGVLRVLGRRRRRSRRGTPGGDDGARVRVRRALRGRARRPCRCTRASGTRGSTTSGCNYKRLLTLQQVGGGASAQLEELGRHRAR
jgi:hypothetical protein